MKPRAKDAEDATEGQICNRSPEPESFRGSGLETVSPAGAGLERSGGLGKKAQKNAKKTLLAPKLITSAPPLLAHNLSVFIFARSSAN